MNKLHNINVLVTRPAHQADNLCELIEKAGGIAHKFPAIAIMPVKDKTILEHVSKHIEDFDMAIFVSVNAVLNSIHYLKEHARQSINKLQVAVIGKTTAEALNQQQIKVDLLPKGQFNSENLLVLPELQAVEGKHILLFRGVGGRPLLADTLRQRGAKVTEVICYTRELPKVNKGELKQLFEHHKINVIVSTSAESMRNMFLLVGEKYQQYLQQTTWVVVNKRMLPVARELNIVKEPIVANNVSDLDILNCLENY